MLRPAKPDLHFLIILLTLVCLCICDISDWQTTSTVHEEIYTDEDLDFLIIGDWGMNGQDPTTHKFLQQSVAEAMEVCADEHDSKFIVNVGDNFYKGGKYDYQGVQTVDDEKWNTIWLDVYNGKKLSSINWYTVAGNHDWYNNVSAQIDYSLHKNSRFYLPALFYVRRTTFGPKNTTVAWIHIDTNIFFYDEALQKAKGMFDNFKIMGWDKDGAVEEKLKWIEDRLVENQDAKWIFVIGHHPLIGECAQRYKMKELIPILDRYRVTAYFAGHNHVLEFLAPTRRSRFAQFISGAGSRTSKACESGDWVSAEGAVGFLHVRISDKSGKMIFEFVDATDSDIEGGTQ
ncbi:8622_t:CDS:2, partial [Paraglomus occultum]